MSRLLFLDESGHDHRTTPYEVRGGIALGDAQLWPFVRAMKNLEIACFGDSLHRYGVEVKGYRLLDKDRFAWAAHAEPMDDAARCKHARAFLTRGTQKNHAKRRPTQVEFTAYGKACLRMARGIFDLLRSHDATLFAVAIPSHVRKPSTFVAEEYLRKDHVFLLERYGRDRRSSP